MFFLIHLLALAVLAGPLTAVAAPDPTALLDGSLTPDRRAALVASLCDGSPVDPSPLLQPSAPWAAQVDGARLIGCAPDAALLPVAIRALARSKLRLLRDDADIYERIARYIVEQPPADVDAAFRALPPGELVTWAGDSLCAMWLGPVSGERFDCAAWRPQIPAEAVAGAVEGWLAEVHRGGGLTTLLQDRGNSFWWLLERLQGELLAQLVRDADVDDALLAADVSRMLLGAHTAVAAGLDARAADGDDERWRGARSRLGDLHDWGARSTSQPGGVLRPWPVAVPPATLDFVVPPPPAPGPGLAPRGVGLFLGLMLLALIGGRRSKARERWFAAAAASLGIALVFGAEWGLALADLPADRGDAERPASDLFDDVVIDGVSYGRTTSSAGRYQMFEMAPPEADCRVFTLGGSSVHGSYYVQEEAFAAVLARRLRDRLPRAEVINLGVGAATSAEVRAAAAAAMTAGADVLVLYMGNNDLEHLPLLADMRGASAESVGAQSALGGSRIARVLRAALGSTSKGGAPSAEPGEPLMDDQPLEGARLQALLDLAAAEAVRNMRAVISDAEDAGIATVVAIQLLNEDFCPPGRDDEHPRSCFSDRVRRIAEGAVAGTRATLIDVPAALRAHAGGPAGHAYFRDFVHPSQLGHAVIGEALAPAVRGLCSTLSEPPRRPGEPVPPPIR